MTWHSVILYSKAYISLNVIGQAVDQLQIRSQNGWTLWSRWTHIIGQLPSKAESKHHQKKGKSTKHSTIAQSKSESRRDSSAIFIPGLKVQLSALGLMATLPADVNINSGDGRQIQLRPSANDNWSQRSLPIQMQKAYD